jgi:hypothetical protein
MTALAHLAGAPDDAWKSKAYRCGVGIGIGIGIVFLIYRLPTSIASPDPEADSEGRRLTLVFDSPISFP